MVVLWILVFSSHPAFLLLGALGVMGDDGKKAAEYVGVMYVILMLILLVVGGGYLLLRSLGLVS